MSDDNTPHLATIVPFGFEFDPVALTRAYRALGCVRAQYYRNPDKQPDIEEVRAASQAAGVPFDSIHGIFGPHIDPSSDDADHREHCVEIYRDEAALALELDAHMVVVHPSAYREDLSLYPRDEADRLQEARWANLEDFLPRLAEVGDELGVIFLVENLPHIAPLGHDPAALAARIADVGSDNLKMCFDTGHANMTGDLLAALKACAPVIGYFHVHDNDTTYDDHRLPGEGVTDWPAFGRLLREHEITAPRMLELFLSEDRIRALVEEGFANRLADWLALKRPE